MSFVVTFELDEAGVVRLAELIALKIRPGDAIALSGDLGAGKTTLARALIAALLEDAAAEVPSPTFSLRQEYATRRLTVAHFDFYRLGSADEAAELGLDDVLETGAAIVEWPERAAGPSAGQPVRDHACRDDGCGRAARDAARVWHCCRRGRGGSARSWRSSTACRAGAGRASPTCRAMRRPAAMRVCPDRTERPC